MSTDDAHSMAAASNAPTGTEVCVLPSALPSMQGPSLARLKLLKVKHLGRFT